MNYLIDDVAKILAKPMARRETFRLLGGAFAAATLAAFGVQPASAAGKTCTQGQLNGGSFNCGNGVANSICCPPGTCCAKHGNDASCCTHGQCACSNGLCQSSSGGNCPSGCTRCP